VFSIVIQKQPPDVILVRFKWMIPQCGNGEGMVVKIVTDSGSDISREQAEDLDVTVVPVYLRFGDVMYRDGVDIDCNEFYQRLMTSQVHPSTAAPSPGDFAGVYEHIGRENTEIVSIHITKEHSAVYDSARAGKEIAAKEGRTIEVVDSGGVTVWQCLVVLAAARAAKEGQDIKGVMEVIRQTTGQLRALAFLDTMKYIIKGGRLSDTIYTIEALLNVRPFLTIKRGQIKPVGMARSRARGIERLHEFIRSSMHIEEIAIAYSTFPDDALELADYTTELFPHVVPHINRIGPALGVHTGPGALIAVLRTTG
jgi:DegV family protein with EDD domain